MAKTEFQTVLLFGAPGVGKGTQGAILGRIPGYFHLSCGEVFRSLDMNSPDGREIYNFSSRGELVPDDLTIKVWHRHLYALTILSHYKPYEDLLVLDGIPRNVEQAKLLEEHVRVNMVIHLTSPDKEAMIHRIRRRAIRENRADDASESVVRRRFEIYEGETKPVLSYYPKNIVKEVNGFGSPSEVLIRVLQLLSPLQNAIFRKEDQKEDQK